MASFFILRALLSRSVENIAWAPVRTSASPQGPNRPGRVASGKRGLGLCRLSRRRSRRYYRRMYADLARTVLLGADEEIRRIIEKHPHADRYELADRLVARAALRCAAVGAVASAPAGFLAALPAAADLAYQ